MSWLSEVDEVRNKDVDILIAFLTHLEFCHEISDQALHQLISEQYPQVSGERYYLFPCLISLKADDTVWQMQSTTCDYNFGWILKMYTSGTILYFSISTSSAIETSLLFCS